MRLPENENDGVDTGGVAATCPCLPGVGVAMSAINNRSVLLDIQIVLCLKTMKWSWQGCEKNMPQRVLNGEAEH